MAWMAPYRHFYRKKKQSPYLVVLLMRAREAQAPDLVAEGKTT